jgi:hypothetical protein
MSGAATYAIVPDFLRFEVGTIGLELGGAHGDYERLERGIIASLSAIAGQPITSAAQHLDALQGKLVILDAEEDGSDWSGSIRRSAFGTGTPDAPDYVVSIDLSPAAFDRLLAMMQGGRTPTALSLDFQNVDGPLNEDPLDRPIPWDDTRYPHVALTNFLLRWA